MGNMQRVADHMQKLLCKETVTLYRYPETVTADSPYQEPDSEPTYTEIPIKVGVNTTKSRAKIVVNGQEIEADYTLIITVKKIKAAGIEVETQPQIDRLLNDRVLIRGIVCTIVKTYLTGEGQTWVTIHAVRDNI